MAIPLIIVESPAKAKTISKFLGGKAVVESSIGHIRDLPSSADEIPDAYKKKPWARTGVNVEDGFEPLYVVPAEKKAQVKKLKDLLAGASELYLATDEDREGEAIAWHLNEVLKPKVPVRRMVFHEITEKAIKHAIAHPRGIDDKLVEAQEARRILDRLYGYEVSPVLWRKIAPRLSAGRVQSVATRLIVERERLRLAFKSGSYYGLTATVTPVVAEATIAAEVVEVFGRRIATSKDFDAGTGALSEAAKKAEVLRLSAALADAVKDALSPDEAGDRGHRRRQEAVHPEAVRAVHHVVAPAGGGAQAALHRAAHDAHRAAAVRERLHHVHAHRLDDAVDRGAGRGAQPGREPVRPRVPAGAAAGLHQAGQGRAGGPRGDPPGRRGVPHARVAQGAARGRSVEALRPHLEAHRRLADEGRHRRAHRGAHVGATLAGDRRRADRAGHRGAHHLGQGAHLPRLPARLRRGLRRSRRRARGSGEGAAAAGRGRRADRAAAEAKEHTTQPPFRFTEASLVKELEDRGIGRPSTYASIIQTIQDRGYVFKKGGALVPTLTAFAVTNLLETHFGELVDYAFTAKMEDDLDTISAATRESRPWLSQFYFGDAGPRPIVKHEAKPEGERNGHAAPGAPGPGRAARQDRRRRRRHRSARHLRDPDRLAPDGEPVVARVGRYGPYVQIGDSDRRANLPLELPLDELTVEKALDLLTPVGGLEPLGRHRSQDRACRST
jgi:DNA topoisomerase-1